MTQLAPLVYLDTDLTPSDLSKGAISLPLLSSAAFGDGSHPTTRLCAGAVDFLCRQKSLAVLDVGTGNGVLARIARARGANRIAATEIDPLAIESARKNIALDSCSLEIPVLDALPDHWGPTFDLVVANILENPLKELAAHLTQALKSEGTLLLSGFTPLQVASIVPVFTAQGLTYVNESTLEGWSLLMFRRH